MYTEWKGDLTKECHCLTGTESSGRKHCLSQWLSLVPLVTKHTQENNTGFIVDMASMATTTGNERSEMCQQITNA